MHEINNQVNINEHSELLQKHFKLKASQGIKVLLAKLHSKLLKVLNELPVLFVLMEDRINTSVYISLVQSGSLRQIVTL